MSDWKDYFWDQLTQARGELRGGFSIQAMARCGDAMWIACAYQCSEYEKFAIECFKACQQLSLREDTDE